MQNFHFKTRSIGLPDGLSDLMSRKGREGNLLIAVAREESDAHVVNGRDKLHAANLTHSLGVPPNQDGGNLGGLGQLAQSCHQEEIN